MEAIRHEQWAAADFILARGYDPVAPFPDLDTRNEFNWSDHPGRVALAEAAVRGRKDIVDLLLKKGVRFDKNSQAGRYVVRELVRNRRLELLKLMLAARAKPDGHLDGALEPLYYAIRFRDLDGLKLLLEAGADPGAFTGLTNKTSSGLSDREQWEKEDFSMALQEPLVFCASQNWFEGAQALVSSTRVDIGQALVRGKPHLKATQPAVRAVFLRAELEAMSRSRATDGAGIDLFTAIAAGKQTDFEVALARPGSMDFRGLWGETALMFACTERTWSMARQLLDTGARLDQFDRIGSTPLCYAARFGDIELVEAMVRKGADLNLVQNQANRALDQAISEGSNPAMALKLIQLGASYAPHPKKPGVIPLFQATASNFPEVVRELLRRGDNPNQLSEGYSIFFSAARSNNPELIQLYCDLKCDLTRRGPENWTPLITAVRWGASASVRKLLELGLRDPHAVVMAISMVKDSQPPNRPDPIDLRGLHYRPDYHQCLEVMEEFGELTGNPLARASAFWRERHTAQEIYSYVDAGGDVNFRDTTTPLQKIVSQHNAALTAYLLEKGANPKLKGTDQSGETALRRSLEDPASVELLLKFGANPNEIDQDRTGVSILTIACLNATIPLETIRALVRYGADPEVDARRIFARDGRKNDPRGFDNIKAALDGR